MVNEKRRSILMRKYFNKRECEKSVLTLTETNAIITAVR